MDYKAILKSMWKRSNISFTILTDRQAWRDEIRALEQL